MGARGPACGRIRTMHQVTQRNMIDARKIPELSAIAYCVGPHEHSDASDSRHDRWNDSLRPLGSFVTRTRTFSSPSRHERLLNSRLVPKGESAPEVGCGSARRPPAGTGPGARGSVRARAAVRADRDPRGDPAGRFHFAGSGLPDDPASDRALTGETLRVPCRVAANLNCGSLLEAGTTGAWHLLEENSYSSRPGPRTTAPRNEVRLHETSNEVRPLGLRRSTEPTPAG